MTTVNYNNNQIQKVLDGLDAFEKKQVPFIMAVTTNNLAFDFTDTMKEEISGKLHINKRTIPSSLRVRKAIKNKRPYAEIYVDEWSWQHKVLQHHFQGGNRAKKGLEKAMIYLGYIDEKDILTPPPGRKLRPGAYVQMMSYLRLNYKAGYTANRNITFNKQFKKKTTTEYFIITRRDKSHLAPGIYARIPQTNKPICMLRIAKNPIYKKKFDFENTLQKVSNERLYFHFSNAFKRAMASAKW